MRRDLVLGALGIDFVQNAGTIASISEFQEPFFKLLGCRVKGDPSVNQSGFGIVIILKGEETLTQRCLISGRWHIFDVIDLICCRVNTTTKGTTHAFFSAKIKPNDSIKATLLQSFWWLFFSSWLNQEEGIIEVLFSWDCLLFKSRDETT